MVYYGSDGNSPVTSCGSSNANRFYIGKLGERQTICTTTGCGSYPQAFNTTAASTIKAASGAVYGYYVVNGPVGRPSSMTPTSWGQAQGQTANSAFNRWATSYLTRYTIFADVETAAYGWGSNHTANQQVINGFLSRLSNAGVYSSPCMWSTIAGSVSWGPSYTATYWTATLSYAASLVPTCSHLTGFGYYYNACCSGSSCGGSYTGARGFASVVPTLWQYTEHGGSGHNQDLDIASALPA